MSERAVVSTKHIQEEGSLGLYISGFVLSVGLTLAAYLLVTRRALGYQTLIAVIIGLALIQFLGQMYFFLHLGRETKPRWKLLVLGFMVSVVLILVLGSLWIMHNLNYRMTPRQINQYMTSQNGGI